MTRLLTKYQTETIPAMQEQLGISNVNQVPRIEKVVINTGVGRAVQNSKALDTAVNTLRKITGQQPVLTTAKKSIASFKLREGAKIGAKVTLRRQAMYEFLDRLITIVLPRTRDFHGISTSAFDPEGNYSLGLTDQTVFPELSYEDTGIIHGLQINIIISNSNPEQSRKLLELLGFPFERSA